jgi:hypothetical protein
MQVTETSKPISPVIDPTVIGLRKRFRWAKRLEQLGGILVVLGVAGELYVEMIASPIQERLRQSSAESIAASGREAADANLKAAKANERAESEHLARIKLESSMSRRSLTKGQQLRLAQMVARLRGTDVDIFTFDGDEWTRWEAALLSHQIADAFDKAGIGTRELWGSGCVWSFGRPLVGVQVLVMPDEVNSVELERAEVIRKGLKDLHVEMSYFPQPMPTCNMFSSGAAVNLGPHPVTPSRHAKTRIVVMVGEKPPVMLRRPTVYDTMPGAPQQ